MFCEIPHLDTPQILSYFFLVVLVLSLMAALAAFMEYQERKDRNKKGGSK